MAENKAQHEPIESKRPTDESWVAPDEETLVIPATTVLVPCDFSDMSLVALRTATRLVAEDGRIHALNVLPPLVPSEPGVLWGEVDDASRIEHASAALRETVEAEGVSGAGVHVEIGTGNPAATIVRVAERLGADLIVLPSHGRTGLARVAIGSVAERVVRYAHCPVLVLRS